MVNPNKKRSGTNTAPNILELKETYIGQYVNTPLSFWDDGIASVKKGSSAKMLFGRIDDVKIAKKGKNKITMAVHYEPHKDEGDTVCKLYCHIINNMLMPLSFKPAYDTFFDEDYTDTDRSDDDVPKTTAMKKDIVASILTSSNSNDDSKIDKTSVEKQTNSKQTNRKKGPTSIRLQ